MTEKDKKVTRRKPKIDYRQGLRDISLINKIDRVCNYPIDGNHIIDIIRAEIKRWRDK